MSLHHPCPWQLTQLATACQPLSWHRHQQSSVPSATCLLSLFIEYHCPSTGLCSQAPGFQSALWVADRGQAGWGRLPCLYSYQLLAQGVNVGTNARNPDGNCCHLIMHAYDISQKHLSISCGLKQIKWRGRTGSRITPAREWLTRLPAATQPVRGRLSLPTGGLTNHPRKEKGLD